MQHPLLKIQKQTTSQSNPLWSYAFLASAFYFAFRKENKFLIENNPHSKQYYDKYFNSLEGKELEQAVEANQGHATFLMIPEHRDDIKKVFTQLHRIMIYCGSLVRDDLSYEARKKVITTLKNDVKKVFKGQQDPEQIKIYLGRLDKLDDYYKHYFGDAENELDSAHIHTELAPLKRAADHLFNQFHHHLENMTYNERYKPLLQISWNKPFQKLLKIFEEKSSELADVLSGKAIEAEPVESKLFLKVNDKLAWFLINSNYCPFEEEAMGHCARSPSGTRLLSLRKFDDTHIKKKWGHSKETKYKHKFWIPVVTATVKLIADNSYRISDIYGQDNTKPDFEYQTAIFNLLADNRIGEWQQAYTDSGFDYETDFEIDQLKTLAKLNSAFKSVDIFEIKDIENFSKSNDKMEKLKWNDHIKAFTVGDYFHLSELEEALYKHSSNHLHKKVERNKEWFEEFNANYGYNDHFSLYKGEYQDYLDHLDSRKYYPYLLKIIKEFESEDGLTYEGKRSPKHFIAWIKDRLKEARLNHVKLKTGDKLNSAIQRAVHDAEAAGAEKDAYISFENLMDDAELTDNNEEKIAKIIKRDGKFVITMTQKQAIKYIKQIKQDHFSYNDLSVSFDRIEYDYSFDDDAFKESVTNQLYEEFN